MVVGSPVKLRCIDRPMVAGFNRSMVSFHQAGWLKISLLDGGFRPAGQSGGSL